MEKAEWSIEVDMSVRRAGGQLVGKLLRATATPPECYARRRCVLCPSSVMDIYSYMLLLRAKQSTEEPNSRTLFNNKISNQVV